jgi:hypothetical protein
LAQQDILCADVFVEIGPMDAFSSADQAPIITLAGLTVQQAGIPGQWNGDRPPVNQIYYQ